MTFQIVSAYYIAGLMIDNFYLALSTIMLVPIVPAFILYKYLPESKTQVKGPFHGLSIKLTGAFGGYFLLVVIGVALQYSIMTRKDGKSIEELTRKLGERDTVILDLKARLKASENPVIDWHVNGIVSPTTGGTRFFYDDGTTESNPDGSFALIKRCIASAGVAKPPKWICVYNRSTGFKVVSLNREVNHPDISAYNISFNDATHEISIGNPVEINSLEKDSIVAVASFIEKTPVLKQQVLQSDPDFLNKTDALRKRVIDEKSTRLKFEKKLAVKPVTK